MAHGTGALRNNDLKRVTVDTTVQPKAITLDRCRAAACGNQGAQPSGGQGRHVVAAILPADRQGRQGLHRHHQPPRPEQPVRAACQRAAERVVFGVINASCDADPPSSPSSVIRSPNLGLIISKAARDAANVILPAVGHSFHRILAWLRDFWRLL